MSAGIAAMTAPRTLNRDNVGGLAEVYCASVAPTLHSCSGAALAIKPRQAQQFEEICLAGHRALRMLAVRCVLRLRRHLLRLQRTGGYKSAIHVRTLCAKHVPAKEPAGGE